MIGYARTHTSRGRMVRCYILLGALALAAVAPLGLATAQAQAPSLRVSRVVVPAGQTTTATITGAPGAAYALVGSPKGAGLVFGGLNLAVGNDFVLISRGTLDASGAAIVTVTPPFLGSELDRYYIQAATSASAAFQPLEVTAGVVLANGDLSALGTGAQGPAGPQGRKAFKAPPALPVRSVRRGRRASRARRACKGRRARKARLA